MPEPAPPPIFDLLNEIGIISQLSRAAMEARTPDGVVLPHFSVLNHLVRLGDGRTPIQIAKAFQMPKNSLTHTLGGLEDRGWIEMRPNPDDKRSKLVFLTDAGREFRQQTVQNLARDFQAIFPEIQPDEIEAVLPTLRKLRALLDSRRD